MLINKNPLISVICPFYNEENYIKETLESILNQSYKNIELILINDGSTDKSFNTIKDILKKDSRIKYFIKKKKSFITNPPRNYGIQKAKGEFIAFIDGDDVWKPNKLELQINDIKIKKKIILSCTAADYRIEKNNLTSNFILNYIRTLLQKFFILKINNSNYHWLYAYNPIINSSVLIKKKIFKQLKINEAIDIREDLDLWIQLSTKYKNFIHFNNKILVTIRRKKKSITSNYIKEINIFINTVNKNITKNKNYNKINFFLFGIFWKVIKIIIRKNYFYFKRFFLNLIIILSFLYFIIFYTPLFWYLGNPLLYSDNLKKIETLVISLDTGYTPYFNNSYKIRYNDLLNIDNPKLRSVDIYIYGRKQTLPDQFILKSLLKEKGFSEDKITLILDEYDTSFKNITYIKNLLKNKNINSIIFITGPYNTFRSKLFWNHIAPEMEVLIMKTTDWPQKHSFFERSMNKKIIISEYLSLIKYKLFLSK
jgi:glycosyltransferase involved in cell wall biosynthesis